MKKKTWKTTPPALLIQAHSYKDPNNDRMWRLMQRDSNNTALQVDLYEYFYYCTLTPLIVWRIQTADLMLMHSGRCQPGSGVAC